MARVAPGDRGGSLEPVDGAVLWEEPWVPRFVAAGRYPPFIDVQWHVAEHGEHFQAALDVARILGVRTERAVALFFDRAVQQGPAAARQMADQLRAQCAPRHPEVLLHAYADLAASRFRRTEPPESTFYSPHAKHIVWQRVGVEWHAVAGRWDLFLDITRRSSRIIGDPSLSDGSV